MVAAVILCLSEAGHHDGSTWQSEITPFIVKKQKRKGREWGLTGLFVGDSRDMGLPMDCPPLTSQSYHRVKATLFTLWPLGTFQSQLKHLGADLEIVLMTKQDL